MYSRDSWLTIESSGTCCTSLPTPRILLRCSKPEAFGSVNVRTLLFCPPMTSRVRLAENKVNVRAQFIKLSTCERAVCTVGGVVVIQLRGPQKKKHSFTLRWLKQRSTHPIDSVSEFLESFFLNSRQVSHRYIRSRGKLENISVSKTTSHEVDQYTQGIRCVGEPPPSVPKLIFSSGFMRCSFV